MKGLLSGQASEDFNHPLRLTADQLASYLTQIESYFKVEYELLLRQVAELTAKSIVLSGEQAAERMEQMKALGFDGFGQIEVINFDRVLWVFLFVAIVGFLVLVLGNPNMNQQQMEGTARFTFAMAFASLIGAVVGSRRRHTAALATPWGAYISAGIAAGLLYVGIQVSYGLARSLLPAGSGQMDPAILLRSLPWALLPCFVTLAICRLARQSQWPPPHLFHGLGNIWVRTIDGVLVSGALLIAYILAVEIIQMTDPSLMPPRIASAMQSGTLRLPIPVLVPLQIMGFIIGFSVVMDVRRAAHAKVVLGKDDAKASAVPVGATGVPA